MSIIDRLFEEFLESLPPSVKKRLFPILLVVLLEIGTYFIFAFFFFPAQGKEAFRSVLTRFDWQVISISEISLVAGIAVLWSAKKLSAQNRKRKRVLTTVAAILIFAILPVFYFAFHPRTLEEERVDIFYLEYPRPVGEFDKDLLMELLTYGGKRGVRISFNWVDWSGWSVESGNLGPLEKLDRLVQKYEEKYPSLARLKNPIGITSRPLTGNLFSVTPSIPGSNLSVVSIEDWEMRYAPPTVYQYLLHMIFLTTIRYRLNDAGAKIREHRTEDSGPTYFHRVIEKSDLREIICSGHFTKEDEETIRKFLGKESLEAYRDVLSLQWLEDEDLQRQTRFRPTYP